MAGRPVGSGAGVRLTESHRAKIETSKLLNRLQDYANGKVELTQGQIQAINILLKKALPDLQAIQHTDSEGGPVKINIGWIKE